MKHFNQYSPLRGIRGGLFLFLLLPLFALTLTSCGDDEEGTIDPYEKTAYYLHYWFEPNAGFCEYYDITATYVTLSGEKVTVAVTDQAPLNYEERVSIKSMPNPQYACTVSASVKPSVNVEAIPEDLKGDFLYKYEMELSKLDNAGERYPVAHTYSKHIDPYSGDFVWELGAQGAPVKKFLTTYPTRELVKF